MTTNNEGDNIFSSSESSPESSPEGVVLEGDTFSIQNIINVVKSSAKYLQIVLITLVISILFSIYLWNRINNDQLELYIKIIIVIIPQLLAYIFLKFYYAPSPKYHYFLSVLYDDEPLQVGKTHKNKGSDWPFFGSASITMNKNEYIFIGGGEGQDDQLLIYDNKNFKNVINGTGLNSKSKTYSAVAVDMNNDGKDDLIVGRSNGVFLYLQQENGTFKSIKIMEPLDKVPLALSVSDFNKNGNPDVYISYFTKVNKYKGSVFNDPSHNRQNVLLQNNTDKNKPDNIKFVDVTTKTKSGGKYNTFTSIFVDLNNDFYPDLVLSNDSGEIEILENVKGEYFKTHTPYIFKGNWMLSKFFYNINNYIIKIKNSFLKLFKII